MRRSDSAADKVARRYDERSLQGYARWKLKSDPAYDAVVTSLRGRRNPLVDLGCGVGLLPFYLREHGYSAPVIGVDFDTRKIERARRAAQAYVEVDFIAGDARDPLPAGHDVVMLDLLHYFPSAAQQEILRNVAAAIPPGGVLVVRQGLRDGSWRYRVQQFVDGAARIARWMRAEALNYPTREELLAPFAGFDVDVRPLWGRTPFNNYFFVVTRPR